MGLVRLLVLVVVAVGSLATPAWAAPPTVLHATSEREGIVLLSGPRTMGNVTHVEFAETVMLTGDLTSSEPSVLHLSCTIVGTKRMSCHGRQVFTGTVEGVTAAGTTTSAVRFTCSLPEQRCTGSSTVVDGTGGLADVRGRATFVADLTTGTSDVTMYRVRP